MSLITYILVHRSVERALHLIFRQMLNFDYNEPGMISRFAYRHIRSAPDS